MTDINMITADGITAELSSKLHEVVLSRMGYIRAMAWKYADQRPLRHTEVEDLVQEGLIGALVAIRNGIEQERGVRDLQGYAMGGARLAMIRYIYHGGDDLLGRDYRHSPSFDDVRFFSTPLRGGNGERVLLDVLEDKISSCGSECDREGLCEVLYDAISRLSFRHRDALGMRYGLFGYGKYTEEEAARVLGITKAGFVKRLRWAEDNLRRDAELRVAILGDCLENDVLIVPASDDSCRCCSGPLEPSVGRRKRLYCGESCRRKYTLRQRRAVVVTDDVEAEVMSHA